MLISKKNKKKKISAKERHKRRLARQRAFIARMYPRFRRLGSRVLRKARKLSMKRRLMFRRRKAALKRWRAAIILYRRSKAMRNLRKQRKNNKIGFYTATPFQYLYRRKRFGRSKTIRRAAQLTARRRYAAYRRTISSRFRVTLSVRRRLLRRRRFAILLRRWKRKTHRVNLRAAVRPLRLIRVSFRYKKIRRYQPFLPMLPRLASNAVSSKHYQLNRSWTTHRTAYHRGNIDNKSKVKNQKITSILGRRRIIRRLFRAPAKIRKRLKKVLLRRRRVALKKILLKRRKAGLKNSKKLKKQLRAWRPKPPRSQKIWLHRRRRTNRFRLWMLFKRATKLALRHRLYNVKRKKNRPRAKLKKAITFQNKRRKKLERRFKKRPWKLKKHLPRIGVVFNRIKRIKRRIKLARIWFRTRRELRFRKRYRRAVITHPNTDDEDRRPWQTLLRKFSRRRAARTQVWLSAVLRKTRRTRFAGAHLVARERARNTQLTNYKTIEHKTRRKALLLLRTAVRIRGHLYRRARKRLLERRRRKLLPRLRRHSMQRHRRYTLCKITVRPNLRRQPRKLNKRRERRHRGRFLRRAVYPKVWKYGGMKWTRWRRIRTRFIKKLAKRKLYDSRPGLLKRGRWRRFYSDRIFTAVATAETKVVEYTIPGLLALPTRKPKPHLLGLRSLWAPRWYSGKKKVKWVLRKVLKKNIRLRRAIRRRVRGTRCALTTAAYAFNRPLTGPRFVTRPYAKRRAEKRICHNVWRRWWGKAKKFHKARKFNVNFTPQHAIIRNERRSRRRKNKNLIGARTAPRLLTRQRRVSHRITFSTAALLPARAWSPELQQFVQPNFAQKYYYRHNRAVVFRRKSRKQVKRTARRSRRRFFIEGFRAEKTVIFDYGYGIWRKKNKKRPHMWRQHLALLDQEFNFYADLDLIINPKVDDKKEI